MAPCAAVGRTLGAVGIATGRQTGMAAGVEFRPGVPLLMRSAGVVIKTMPTRFDPPSNAPKRPLAARRVSTGEALTALLPWWSFGAFRLILPISCRFGGWR